MAARRRLTVLACDCGNVMARRVLDDEIIVCTLCGHDDRWSTRRQLP